VSIRRMSYDAWAEALARTHGKPDFASYMGASPGGAAAELGVSRQRIWQLLKDGRLDLVMLADDDKAKVSAWVVTKASMERYRRSKPGVQQDLPLRKTRRIRTAS